MMQSTREMLIIKTLPVSPVALRCRVVQNNPENVAVGICRRQILPRSGTLLSRRNAGRPNLTSTAFAPCLTSKAR